MIVYLKHRQIDKTRWDACIEHSIYKIMYAWSWYLDVVSPNWDALVMGEYEAVFPLTWKRKFGLQYLAQPDFAQHLGIFSKHHLGPGQVVDFLKAIPTRFVHYDLCLNPGNALPAIGRFRYQRRKTCHLKLNRPYEEIRNGYSGDTERNLQRHAGNGITLEELGVAEVITLYRNYVWHKTPGLKAGSFQVLEQLVATVAMRRGCLVLGAFENGMLSAGAVFLLDEWGLIFLFAATGERGRKNGAMRILIDQVIRTYSERNLVLDFEGSSTPSVAYFYEGFGAEVQEFYRIRYSRFPLLGSILKLKGKFKQALAKTRRIRKTL